MAPFHGLRGLRDGCSCQSTVSRNFCPTSMACVEPHLVRRPSVWGLGWTLLPSGSDDCSSLAATWRFPSPPSSPAWPRPWWWQALSDRVALAALVALIGVAGAGWWGYQRIAIQAQTL